VLRDASGAPPQCQGLVLLPRPACPAVNNATAVVCTNATDSKATACAGGYYVDEEGRCARMGPRPDVRARHINSRPVCASPTLCCSSKCHHGCSSLDHPHPPCKRLPFAAECASVTFALTVDCTNGTASRATSCTPGYYAAPNGTCVPCTGISNATAVVCTTNADSEPTECEAGTYISSGACLRMSISLTLHVLE
jgi:hypothetical protein